MILTLGIIETLVKVGITSSRFTFPEDDLEKYLDENLTTNINYQILTSIFWEKYQLV